MRLRLPDRFIRRCHSDARGIATLSPRQIYILPTRYGLAFALLLVLMWIGSVNYANNLGFLLTFLLTGLGLVTMLHTWRNLLGIRCQALRSEPVFKGQTAIFRIQLGNRRRTERPQVSLRLEGGAVSTCDLPVDGHKTLQLSARAERRGRFHLPRCVISTTYPLGLLQAWSYLHLDGEVLVYPVPGDPLPASDQPSYRQSQQGDKGVGSDDFVGLRGYRAGDSPRQIDWKSHAREQGLHTKQFGGDRSDRRWLEWQALAPLPVEARLSALCRGVLDAAEQQQEFGLRLPGLELPPARGEKQRLAALQALALFGEGDR